MYAFIHQNISIHKKWNLKIQIEILLWQQHNLCYFEENLRYIWYKTNTIFEQK